MHGGNITTLHNVLLSSEKGASGPDSGARNAAAGCCPLRARKSVQHSSSSGEFPENMSEAASGARDRNNRSPERSAAVPMQRGSHAIARAQAPQAMGCDACRGGSEQPSACSSVAGRQNTSASCIKGDNITSGRYPDRNPPLSQTPRLSL